MCFTVTAAAVDDLMDSCGGEADQAPELRKLQQCLSTHRVYLEQIYITFGKSRRDFEELVAKTSGIEDCRRSANEIFSIATDRFAAEEDKLGHGTDCTMSRLQFTTAIIRLANLCALINGSSGMAGSQKLSRQMDDFLTSAKANAKDCY